MGIKPPGERLREASFRRIKQHADLTLRAADDRGFGHQRNLLHGVIHLGDEAAQREMIVTRAVER
jgi:hypothetical protein